MAEQPLRMVAVTPTSFAAGGELALLRLVSLACTRGWQATVLVPAGPLTDRFRAAGAMVEVIPELKLPRGPKALGALAVAGRSVHAARTVRRVASGADVVVANSTLVLPAVRLARVACPVVHLVRDVIREPRFRLLLRLFGSTGDLAVAPSDAAAEALRRNGLEVRVVHHGTRWPIEPAYPQPGRAVVGMAAYITPLKGQDVALEAMARLRQPDVALEVAGDVFHRDREFAARLRVRAAQPDLEDRVRFLGHVQDVTNVMRHWRIVLMPSVQPESAGLTMLEAMSLGIPVVASDHGGPSELLGDAGLLVPPGDPDALAEAISRLLDDSAFYESCSRAGRHRVAEHFDLARQDGELLDVIAQVSGMNEARQRSVGPGRPR